MMARYLDPLSHASLQDADRVMQGHWQGKVCLFQGNQNAASFRDLGRWCSAESLHVSEHHSARSECCLIGGLGQLVPISRHIRTTTSAIAMAEAVSLGKGAWDCDANCEIPPEKEVHQAQLCRGSLYADEKHDARQSCLLFRH